MYGIFDLQSKAMSPPHMGSVVQLIGAVPIGHPSCSAGCTPVEWVQPTTQGVGPVQKQTIHGSQTHTLSLQAIPQVEAMTHGLPVTVRSHTSIFTPPQTVSYAIGVLYYQLLLVFARRRVLILVRHVCNSVVVVGGGHQRGV